jgi:hypothetical protein
MPSIIHSKLLSPYPNLTHGLSTKKFGPLSFEYHKNPGEVIKNRKDFFNKLNLSLDDSVFCEQKHTDNISIVDAKDRGKGARDLKSRVLDTDALITQEKNVNLVVLTADCLPILIFDTKKEVIAAVHAGWKGVINKITIKTLSLMQQKFGSKKIDLKVYIGPSIGPCCYSSNNDEQIELFQKNYNNLQKRKNQISENQIFIDLWDSIETDLINFKIPKKNIENSKICTACNHDHLASHRADDPRDNSILSVIRYG